LTITDIPAEYENKYFKADFSTGDYLFLSDGTNLESNSVQISKGSASFDVITINVTGTTTSKYSGSDKLSIGYFRITETKGDSTYIKKSNKNFEIPVQFNKGNGTLSYNDITWE
jgi:outer membrane scaffolding protein for murein synthesis (MipA/OmpV family)